MKRLFLLFAFVVGCQQAAPPPPTSGDAPMDVDIVDPEDIPDAPVLSAEEAIEGFVVEDGFEVQIVAREPDVVDPVAMAIDEDGALWVVEMRDYMTTTEGDNTGEPAGRIVVLRDEDGDGFHETSSVFLDGLYLPRAIAIYNGGVLYSVPPNLYFAKRNGYEAGDISVVDAEYAVGGNPEHQPNGLLVAMDNWIYNAKSDQRYRLQNGKWLKEKTEYRGQWGISQDDWGRLFYNNNSQTLLGDDVLPSTVARNPHREISDRRVYGPSRATNKTYPIRVNPGVNRGYRPGTLDEEGKLANVTSAAGPVIYRGDNFPPEYNGNAFVQETVGNLVKRVMLADLDGTVVGTEPYQDAEFLASTDERFRPVNGYTAPDGSLYIMDMYRGVVQHSTYLTDYLKRQIEMRDLDMPLGLGRIYRVKYTNNPLRPNPTMSRDSDEQLVANLSHPNGWWRDTAQRLLIERKSTRIKTALEALATGAGDARTRVHALWTLEGLGLVSASTLEMAARSEDDKVRASVARVAAVTGHLGVLESMTTDSSLEVARYVAAGLGMFRGAQNSRAWRAQLIVAQTQNEAPEIIDTILGSLEDREQQFLDATGGGSIVSALKHAAGMALVQDLSAVRLLPTAFEPSYERGAEVYSVFCSTCHGREGEGLESIAPPLVKSQWVLQDEARLARLVLDGVEGPMDVNGTTYTVPDVVDHMPGVRDLDYTDEQIADVLTFVRNAWGNQSTGVSSELVTRIRSADASPAYTAASLRATETDWSPLIQGNTLNGWTKLNGEAEYQVAKGVITGITTMNTPNTFLATDKMYDDFILELSFRVDSTINSGIQIRSNSLPEYNNGRVHGYQVEIDPSERAWTAGIYDEGRRGWLFNLQGRPAAQRAFRQGEWNHLRVETRDDHIRTWLNGVLAADLIDSMTRSGFIALQVHSIGREEQAGRTVEWKDIRIRELN